MQISRPRRVAGDAGLTKLAQQLLNGNLACGQVLSGGMHHLTRGCCATPYHYLYTRYPPPAKRSHKHDDAKYRYPQDANRNPGSKPKRRSRGDACHADDRMCLSGRIRNHYKMAEEFRLKPSREYVSCGATLNKSVLADVHRFLRCPDAGVHGKLRCIKPSFFAFGKQQLHGRVERHTIDFLHGQTALLCLLPHLTIVIYP